MTEIREFFFYLLRIFTSVIGLIGIVITVGDLFLSIGDTLEGIKTFLPWIVTLLLLVQSFRLYRAQKKQLDVLLNPLIDYKLHSRRTILNGLRTGHNNPDPENYPLGQFIDSSIKLDLDIQNTRLVPTVIIMHKVEVITDLPIVWSSHSWKLYLKGDGKELNSISLSAGESKDYELQIKNIQFQVYPEENLKKLLSGSHLKIKLETYQTDKDKNLQNSVFDVESFRDQLINALKRQLEIIIGMSPSDPKLRYLNIVLNGEEYS